jgi:hypothetical protein
MSVVRLAVRQEGTSDQRRPISARDFEGEVAHQARQRAQRLRGTGYRAAAAELEDAAERLASGNAQEPIRDPEVSGLTA